MSPSARRVTLVLMSALCVAVITPLPAWGAPDWVRQVGTFAEEEATAVATDSDFNIYAAGFTYGALGGTNQGLDDSWVAKISPGGQMLWKQQFGTEDYDHAVGVATDGQANVILLESHGGFMEASPKVSLRKLATNGNTLWKRRLSPGNSVFLDANGLTADKYGFIYVAGVSWGSALGRDTGYDAWVAKVDPDGNLIWRRFFGTRDGDGAIGVAVSALGDVYVAGGTNGSLGGKNQGGYDVWLAKFDRNGRAAWKRQLGTPSYERLTGVATTLDGQVYIAGHTEGPLAGRNIGDADAWLAKYDEHGRLLWKLQWGTAKADLPNAVSAGVDGGAVIAGYTQGSLGGPNHGGYDAWWSAFDADGRLRRSEQLGSAQLDYTTSVAVDGMGRVVLGGSTSGALQGANRGETDAFVARYAR